MSATRTKMLRASFPGILKPIQISTISPRVSYIVNNGTTLAITPGTDGEL